MGERPAGGRARARAGGGGVDTTSPSAPGDPFDLARFVRAQDPVWPEVVAELRVGRKTSHWIWFVFPQAAGLGRSETSARYAIRSLAEARAYLADPLLGARLREACDLLLAAPGSAEAILGPLDALKVRSSMTLFERADPAEPRFGDVLGRFFRGEPDAATLDLLGPPDEAAYPR